MPDGPPSPVTQAKLRAALSANGSPRSAAWTWNAELADDAQRSELDELRRSVAELGAQITELRERADTATAIAQDLRAALTRLANAKRRQRRHVPAELRASGLLP